MAEELVTGTGDDARRVHLGIAVGPDGVCAVQLDRTRKPVRQVPPWSRSFERVSSVALRTAFMTLKEHLSCDGAVLHVALLPPLVQARRLELPRLAAAEVRRVLERSAGKYFFDASERQLVGARPLKGAQRSPMAFFAVAAPARVVDALFDAANEVGWQIESVVSAYDAWAEALRNEGPAVSWIVHCGSDLIEGIRLAGCAPVMVRRAPAGLPGAETVADWIGADPDGGSHESSDPVVMIGTAGDREIVAEALERRHVATSVIEQSRSETPPLLAAAYAGRTPGAELLPERVHAARRDRGRRVTLGFAAAAAALIAVAGVAEYWGAQRELQAILRERRALADQVGSVVADRDVLQALQGRLETLSRLAETAPRWSAVVANVAEHLPDDAHLVAFRGGADSVVLEGLADRAAGVFEAMQRAPRILAVRARAPIRRELRDGTNPIERFSLSAQLGAARTTEDDK